MPVMFSRTLLVDMQNPLVNFNHLNIIPKKEVNEMSITYQQTKVETQGNAIKHAPSDAGHKTICGTRWIPINIVHSKDHLGQLSKSDCVRVICEHQVHTVLQLIPYWYRKVVVCTGSSL